MARVRPMGLDQVCRNLPVLLTGQDSGGLPGHIGLEVLVQFRGRLKARQGTRSNHWRGVAGQLESVRGMVGSVAAR